MTKARNGDRDISLLSTCEGHRSRKFSDHHARTNVDIGRLDVYVEFAGSGLNRKYTSDLFDELSGEPSVDYGLLNR